MFDLRKEGYSTKLRHSIQLIISIIPRTKKKNMFSFSSTLQE